MVEMPRWRPWWSACASRRSRPAPDGGLGNGAGGHRGRRSPGGAGPGPPLPRRGLVCSTRGLRYGLARLAAAGAPAAPKARSHRFHPTRRPSVFRVDAQRARTDTFIGATRFPRSTNAFLRTVRTRRARVFASHLRSGGSNSACGNNIHSSAHPDSRYPAVRCRLGRGSGWVTRERALPGANRIGIGRNIGTYSGEPDTPGVRGGDAKLPMDRRIARSLEMPATGQQGIGSGCCRSTVRALSSEV